ncbi:DNA-binding protein [Pedobacter jamesrossensis]|uniref:DNA-binding protein n=1 Tax=Pedobacter jamesrossensis TaxID=1908238 RepID=A0ABV8NNX5_9SPHI
MDNEFSAKFVCMESEAWYAMIKTAVTQIRAEDKAAKEDKWISDEKASNLLDGASTSTLLRLRNSGKIKFTQPTRKLILYDRDSIMAYLNKGTHETF